MNHRTVERTQQHEANYVYRAGVSPAVPRTLTGWYRGQMLRPQGTERSVPLTRPEAGAIPPGLFHALSTCREGT